jgi:hypothetical protein
VASGSRAPRSISALRPRSDGVVDGQEVEVQVKMIHPKKRLPGPPPGWKPGQPSKTAGLLAESWTEEDDRILEEIHRDRKRERPAELGG